MVFLTMSRNSFIVNFFGDAAGGFLVVSALFRAATCSLIDLRTICRTKFLNCDSFSFFSFTGVCFLLSVIVVSFFFVGNEVQK